MVCHCEDNKHKLLGKSAVVLSLKQLFPVLYLVSYLPCIVKMNLSINCTAFCPHRYHGTQTSVSATRRGKLICDKSVTTQNLAFLSYWYRKKRLQMHF